MSTKKKIKLPSTASGYEELLIEMIEKRTEAAFDIFLTPQVSSCAQCWMMLNKVHKELLDGGSLTNIGIGSQGQQKEEVNPLLPYYLKLQAELRLQFQALGLNFNVTPSKIKEDTKKGVDEKDPMAEYYKSNG